MNTHSGPPDYPGAPRWVKVSGILVIVVVVVILLLMVSRAGHGPGRHMRSDDAAGRTPPGGSAGSERLPPASGR